MHHSNPTLVRGLLNGKEEGVRGERSIPPFAQRACCEDRPPPLSLDAAENRRPVSLHVQGRRQEPVRGGSRNLRLTHRRQDGQAASATRRSLLWHRRQRQGGGGGIGQARQVAATKLLQSATRSSCSDRLAAIAGQLGARLSGGNWNLRFRLGHGTGESRRH